LQIAEIHRAGRSSHPIDPSNFRRMVSIIALALLLVVVWLIMHRYLGLDNDAQLYALQALVRIHPALGADLYFQHGSQDAYTAFSPLYASVISLMDLRSATLLLTVLFIAWFLVAAWMLARDLCGPDITWLSVGALIIIPGAYGGSGIFHFSDLFLTARLPAEALVVTALALHFRGWKRLSLAIATGALFIHPLMALPGLLLLICLSIPRKTALIGAGAGIVATLSIALIAQLVPNAALGITVMDPAWLNVVQERSQFLFLNLWSLGDWKLNIQPFLSLVITAIAVPDTRIRKLCVAAAIVGLAGLAVASVGSCVTPVALIIQGQAWRWVWITDFVCILLLAPVVLHLWRDPKCGPLCAVLVAIGWTFSAVDGFTCVSIALTLWLARPYIADRAAPYLRWAGYVLMVATAAWAAHDCWSLLTTVPPASAYQPLALAKVSSIARLGIPAVMVIGVLWHWLRTSRSKFLLGAATLVLLASVVYISPKSLDAFSKVGSPALAEEFEDWRNIIPPTSSVYLADKYDTGAFVWFALDRPNYLSPNQSAGVVFSRATALEIRRRAELMLPLQNPHWKMRSSLRDHGSGFNRESGYRRLTTKALIAVCKDPQLGFVIAKENVGMGPIAHTRGSVWKGWNLYDCQRVRALDPQA
jgi:hypothetical protein